MKRARFREALWTVIEVASVAAIVYGLGAYVHPVFWFVGGGVAGLGVAVLRARGSRGGRS